MLADTQFIENVCLSLCNFKIIIMQRVYEDDDGSDEEDTEVTNVQENIDPKANFVDALKLGMEALKLYFDNDDDDGKDKLEVIFQSHQSYCG